MDAMYGHATRPREVDPKLVEELCSLNALVSAPQQVAGKVELLSPCSPYPLTPEPEPVAATESHMQKTSNITDKRLPDAYILAVGLGFLGALHFYLGRPRFGVLYLFTFGLLGVGYIVDWFRVPSLVKEANRKQHANRETPPQKSLSDAYLLWFPLGLIGSHHFYLERWGWGVVYMMTIGLLGIGWLVDGRRMKSMVNETNKKLVDGEPSNPTRRLLDVYLLCLCPVTGLLGFHHYYLKRTAFGVLYTFTLGLLGVGWLVDICRLKSLVARANTDIVDGDDGPKHDDDVCVCLLPLGFLGFHQFYLKSPGWGLLYLCTWVDFCRMNILVNRAHKLITDGDEGRKHLDDAYLCLFPLGFLGLHHFYLRRPRWGVLYFFTFGALGVGWIVDVFRLPSLLRECNGETPGGDQA